MALKSRLPEKKSLYLITDLGGGDGGKGSVIHKVCQVKQPRAVLKVGGAQGSHGVTTSRGQNFNFSQFGCGTLDGIRTHITNLMVIEPFRFLREADLLRYNFGLTDVLQMITVDEDALCITPFQTIASRLQELSRKDKPKGTIGLGTGVTVTDAEHHPELAIYAKDLLATNLRTKLADIRDQKIQDLKGILADLSNLWPADQDCARELVALLYDPEFIDRITDAFQRMGNNTKIVNREYLRREVLATADNLVVESSHGILTDRYYGFHPYTTSLRTMPDQVINLLQSLDYDGQIIKLGVTRAYQIRHGAGPLVTEDPGLAEQLLPGSHKEENRWQGKVRVGPLDLVALRYALRAAGGPDKFDGLAVTWFDQIIKNDDWKICDGYYRRADDPEFFSPEGEILVSSATGDEQLERQRRLGEKLFQCKPGLTTYPLPLEANRAELTDWCSGLLEQKLQVPVRLISFGPSPADKILL